MTAGIQRSDLNQSTYERPQQNWVCGWAAEGNPCRHGPNPKGVCVAAFECTPSDRNGRWHCSRQPVHGGRCEDGPRPDGSCCKPIPKCQPVLSWRARRGKLTRWTMALTLGLLIVSIVWLGPAAVSPGPLNAKHSTAAEGCVSCHFSGHETFPGGWRWPWEPSRTLERAACAPFATTAASTRSRRIQWTPSCWQSGPNGPSPPRTPPSHR